MQKKLDNLNTGIQENLTNVRVVKSFVRTVFEEEKFKKANVDLRDNSINAIKIMICTMPLMTLMMNITTLAVVWFGGGFVIKGGMLVGDLIAFTTYITQILMSLMMVSMIILQGSRALASARRISEVLDTEADISDDDAKMKDAVIKHGTVEFRNVSFAYNRDSENEVLCDISFRIDAGQTVGILGSTGSGKTSLVQLIPRLYDVKSGSVLVDGIDVRDYSLYNLREGGGMVLQKNVLFSGSIEENLLWGDENATKEDIVKAAGYAQAHGFIESFKNGYNTLLEQGGVNVSGGQKQRLCIARALLKKPKILILDDSTSAVDTATEKMIRKAFREELDGSTKIIIAQRISSVKECDLIIVMNEGEITGVGSHAELLENCAEYGEIYYSQMDKKEE